MSTRVPFAAVNPLAGKRPKEKSIPTLNADGSSSSSAAAAAKNPARSAKKNYNSFGTFIYRVLKQVSGPAADETKQIGITKISIDVIDTFLYAMFERIVREATTLARYNKRATISCREIQTAVGLEFPPGITMYCVSEGTKAIAKATKSNAEAAIRAALPDAKKKTGKEESQSKRAGLTFPVGRIRRYMKEMRCSARLTASGPIYLAAVLEYLCAEVLEIAVGETEKHKHLRITPRHLNDAIRADADLSVIVGSTVTIPHAGVPSTFVRPPPKNSKKKDRDAGAAIDDLPEEDDVEGNDEDGDDEEDNVSDEEEEAVIAAPPPKKQKQQQAKKSSPPSSSSNGTAASTTPKKKAQAPAPAAADEEDSDSQSGEE